MKFKHTIIIIVAIIFTGFIIFDTLSTYKIASRSSEDILKSTAYFIGVSLDQALHRIGIDEELFLDVIKRQPWEEIAFIALYDENGTILLHSSKRLIGAKSKDSKIKETIGGERPLSSYLTLKTGERIYAMDIPIHIPPLSTSNHLLRVALHTYPAKAALRSAKIHILVAFVLILFLWILAFLFYHYSKKIDELQRKAIEKEHFTMLGEMAAVLAHEIRSPLSAIKGFAQYILERSVDDLSTKEGFDVIISESKRLEKLTEELLTYARTGEINPERFSLSKLVNEAHNLFISDNWPISINKNISLKNDLMYNDREKLRHILINILQNASDSIKDSGVIEINIIEENKLLSISIKDSGKGMDEETLKNAFRPFFTTKVKGTGLGLSIVENLVKSLNATLSIKSQPNKGTTVTVKIPRELR